MSRKKSSGAGFLLKLGLAALAALAASAIFKKKVLAPAPANDYRLPSAPPANPSAAMGPEESTPLTEQEKQALAGAMAADDPDRYVATATKSKRNNRIFIDYLRNSHDATAIAPYSTRARAGAPRREVEAGAVADLVVVVGEREQRPVQHEAERARECYRREQREQQVEPGGQAGRLGHSGPGSGKGRSVGAGHGALNRERARTGSHSACDPCTPGAAKGVRAGARGAGVGCRRIAGIPPPGSCHENASWPL